MNIGKFITDFKEKARTKRITVARAKTETIKQEYKKAKEEADTLRELKAQRSALDKERGAIKEIRQERFKEIGNRLNLGFQKLDGTKSIKLESRAVNPLKDNRKQRTITNIDDRFKPRDIFNTDIKPAQVVGEMRNRPIDNRFIPRGSQNNDRKRKSLF